MTMGLVVALVAFTTWPIFRTPALDPDDYRYVALVHALDSGRVSFLEAAIVENRWDHLWWLDAPAVVRFFRPVVIASYWVDVHVWGARFTSGLLATNVLVHLASALLVASLLLHWFGTGLSALLGAALFASFWAHGETIHYVAGRTDSIAAMLFLAALACHVAGRDRPALRVMAVPIWAVGLLTKETVAALPALLLFHDLWIERRDSSMKALLVRERFLVGFYVAAGLGALGLRSLALQGRAGTPVYPYLVLPTHPEFAGHLVTQARMYAENLLLASYTPPFLRYVNLAAVTSWAGLGLSITAVVGAVWWQHREPLFRWGAMLLVLTWLPASISYVSERYLYLPSVAVALGAALGVQSLLTKPRLRAVAVLVIIVWAGHQAHRLHLKHDRIVNVNFREFATVVRKLEDVRGQLSLGDRVLLVNMPVDWIGAQFTEGTLKVLTRDPMLEVRILSTMPRKDDLGVLATVSAEGERALRLRGGFARGWELAVQWRVAELELFPWVSLENGSTVVRKGLGFSVEVVEGNGTAARDLRIRLPESVFRYRILRWKPDLSPGLTVRQRFEQGRFEFVAL